MNGKTCSLMRKATAAVVALTIVAGGVPAQIFPGYFASTALVASADGETAVSTVKGLEDAFKNGGTYKLSSNIKMNTGGSAFDSQKDVTLDLAGHTLTGNGNAVINVTAGKLTIIDSVGTGKITGGTKSGVCIIGGEFVLSGGSITGNTANEEEQAGGVIVKPGAKFTMTGGKVCGNDADNTYGKNTVGGVRCDGTANISGGEISGNTGTDIGGIAVYDGGKLNMTGGEVKNNKVTCREVVDTCAGIYVAVGGTANLSNCSITGNENYCNNGNNDPSHGAGVFIKKTSATNRGTVNISGKVIIKDNVRYVGSTAVASNYFLDNQAKETINIVGALDKDARIYVDLPYWTGGNGYLMTSGWADNMGADKDPNSYFVSDRAVVDDKAVSFTLTSKPEVKIIAQGELTPHKVTVTNTDTTRGTVEVVSPADITSVAPGTTVKFKVTPENGYEESVIVRYGSSELTVNKDADGFYSFNMTGVDAEIEVSFFKTDVSLVGHQVILDGNINLGFIMNKERFSANDEMTFTLPDGSTIKAKGESIDQGIRFTCPLTSRDMAKKVKASVMNTSYTWVDNSGYSVVDYVAEFKEKNVDIADATDANKADYVKMQRMLDYGSAAQEYFDGATGTALANGGTYYDGKVGPGHEPNYSYSGKTEDAGIKFVSVSLELNTNVRLNLYFEGADSLSTATAGATVSEGSNYKMISIPVTPWKLDDDFTVTAKKGTASASFTYKPIYYIDKILKGTGAFAKMDAAKLTALQRVVVYLEKFGKALG